MCVFFCFVLFFFQAEDGIRYLVRSRGLGDVYKRQDASVPSAVKMTLPLAMKVSTASKPMPAKRARSASCLLYTSDAADERSSVDLGGRRIIKKKTT